MKLIFYSLLLALPIGLQAQNWEPIPLNDTIYYLTADSVMRGFIVENTLVDTAGFERLILSKTLAEDSACGPSGFGHTSMSPKEGIWSGGEIHQYPNGRYLFFNKNSAPIFLETQKAINESWIMHTDAVGNYIQATITALDTATIGGQVDSIKVIKLNAVEVSAPISGWLTQWNNFELKLSKFHGLIDIVDVFYFPSRKILMHQTQLKPLTIGEVYNYEIGDEFQIARRYPVPQPPTTYNYYRVLNKVSNANSVTYTFHHEELITGYSYTQDTIVKTYNDIDLFVGGAIPDKFYYHLNQPVMASGIQHGSTFVSLGTHGVKKGKRITRVYPTFSTYLDSTECVHINGGDPEVPKFYDFVEGIGHLYLVDWYPHDGIVFYRKGIEEYGTKYTEVTELESLNVKVFPNPSDGIINIQLPDSYQGTIKLIDNLGRCVLNESIDYQNSIAVKVDAVDTGYYILEILTTRGVKRIKILVEH